MGMGHYERLLISHLMSESSRAQWQFAFTSDGRISEEMWRADPSQHPDFAARDSLGIANARLLDAPYPVVRALANARFSRSSSSLKKGAWVAPDLFHSLALTFAAPTNKPAIYTIHDLPPARFSDEGRLPRWSKDAARNARLIMTPSEFAKREIVELLEVEPSRVEVIPYGLEHDRFNLDVPVADEATLREIGIESQFLIYAGGASQRKNIPALLEAWRIVAPKHPELLLVLAGPQALVSLVQERDVPRTLAPGYLSRDTLPSVMRASKGLVFPSIYEGFGMPPQEAMAMGVPVVGSKAGGAVPEVVADAGVLAEDGSPEALAAAIETLVTSPELEAKLRFEGPKRAQTYSWPDHARRVLELYRSVLA